MDVQISSHQHNTVEDRPDWLNRSVEENRFECHQQAKKTKLPQKPRKTTGSERRKRDIRNLKKRSKKRIYDLTPKVPSMASILEDEDALECDSAAEELMQSRYQNLTRARRRGSVGSFSLTDSDEEIDEAQTNSHTHPSRAESSRKRLPDYMNLGGADSTPFNPENFYSRFAHALNQS